MIPMLLQTAHALIGFLVAIVLFPTSYAQPVPEPVRYPINTTTTTQQGTLQDLSTNATVADVPSMVTTIFKRVQTR